jgi:hypothetical protein
LAEEIFRGIDTDKSGRVSLVEFVESYFEQQREFEERLEDLNKMIEEDMKKRNEIFMKFNEIKATEQLNNY